MIKALIFDLDGLLVDTEPVFFNAMKTVLRRYGVRLPKRDYIKMDLQNGTSVVEHFRSLGALPNDAPIEQEVYDCYSSLLTNNLREMPGAHDTIRRLSKNFILAIASSSKRRYIDYILTALDLSRYFQVVVSRESISNLKPDPECLRQVLDKLGLQPNECIVIEDSLRGLKAAKAIGMLCVVIPNKFTKYGDYSEADLVLSSLRKLDPRVIHAVSGD